MRIAALLSIALAAPAALAADCPVRDGWPTTDWPSKAAEYATSRATEIAALEQYAFTLEGEDADRKGLRTDALIIVKDGAIIYERYARGFTAGMRHQTWSVSKSLTNALTGVAVKAGKVALDDSVCTYVDGLPQASCAIKLVNLLEFASGLDWKEIYENESNQQSSVLSMLYGQGRTDMARFTGSHALRDPPGTSFQYSTGEATLLLAAVGKPMREAHGEEWPWKVFFDVLGMKSATLERDPAGTFIGGSYFWTTARDLAKFAWLYSNDGCWNGTRVLPEGWVHDSVQVSDAIRRKAVEREAGDVQGRMFWLNRKVPELQQTELPWPDAPEGTYCALGHWGQSACVVPGEDFVVVRYANDRVSGLFDRSKFLKLALAVGRKP